MENYNDSLEDLIRYSKSNNRIVPCPPKWNEIYEMLPNRKRVGAGWDPPIPLILGGWWYSTEHEKQQRFFQHLRYAEKNGIIKEVSGFIRSLTEDEWCHSGNAGCNIDLLNNYSYEVFAPKEKPGKEILEKALNYVTENWTKIAGSLISQATKPLNFSGKKARRLNIQVINDEVRPPWGSWWSLKNSNNPKSFTLFRESVNKSITSHSIDHIFFLMKGKKSE